METHNTSFTHLV